MPDTRRVHHVSLQLARLEELLVPPEPDPLSGRFEERSGVERILDAVRARYTRRLDAIEAKLVVDEQPDAEARRKVKVLIARVWPEGEVEPGQIPGARVIDVDSLEGFCRGWAAGVAR